MRSLLGTDGAAPCPHLSQPGELMKGRVDKVQDAVSFPSEGREVTQKWCWGRMMMFWLPPKIKEARGDQVVPGRAASSSSPHPVSWAVLDFLQLLSLALPRLLAAWKCHPVLQQWWEKNLPVLSVISQNVSASRKAKWWLSQRGVANPFYYI